MDQHPDIILRMLLRNIAVVAFLLSSFSPVHAQWTIQKSNTTANLRGIASLGNGVAWASGSDGTVLRTTDGGNLWQVCAVPHGAKHLDFRAIQAIDEHTAFVMSSGRGALSRLYKTTNGCRSWKYVFSNPDREGFWDGLLYDDADDTLFILGDPVEGKFRLFDRIGDKGKFLSNWNGHPIEASPGQVAFAASNSLLIMVVGEGMFSFIIGGSRSEIIHEEHGIDADRGMFSEWSRSPLPFAAGPSSGAFAIASTPPTTEPIPKYVVVVGGDYQRPDETSQTAAYSDDWGYEWHLAETPPRGYRSSVASDETRKFFIAVGPNGTDISRDHGHNWSPVGSGDASKNWNAISLPFVVGPSGRIGKLQNDGLRP